MEEPETAKHRPSARRATDPTPEPPKEIPFLCIGLRRAPESGWELVLFENPLPSIKQLKHRSTDLYVAQLSKVTMFLRQLREGL
jgi:hypothetical protein